MQASQASKPCWGTCGRWVQGALANADVPFQQVVSIADIPRSSAYTPLFQTMFTMEEGVAESPDVMAAAHAETMEVRHWRSLQAPFCWCVLERHG